MSDLVGNPEDRFSQNVAHFMTIQNENFQMKQCDIFLIFMVVLTSTHNLGFLEKMKKIMYTPVNPSFSI